MLELAMARRRAARKNRGSKNRGETMANLVGEQPAKFSRALLNQAGRRVTGPCCVRRGLRRVAKQLDVTADRRRLRAWREGRRQFPIRRDIAYRNALAQVGYHNDKRFPPPPIAQRLTSSKADEEEIP